MHQMKRRIISQRDNEHLHTEHLTLAKVEKFGWEMFLDPSYSPDLAPSDYRLLGSFKDHMRGKLYKNGAVREPRLCCCQILKWTLPQRHIQVFAALAEMHGSLWEFCGIVTEHLQQPMIVSVFVHLPLL
jgi:hypothetical protein